MLEGGRNVVVIGGGYEVVVEVGLWGRPGPSKRHSLVTRSQADGAG